MEQSGHATRRGRCWACAGGDSSGRFTLHGGARRGRVDDGSEDKGLLHRHRPELGQVLVVGCDEKLGVVRDGRRRRRRGWWWRRDRRWRRVVHLESFGESALAGASRRLAVHPVTLLLVLPAIAVHSESAREAARGATLLETRLKRRQRIARSRSHTPCAAHEARTLGWREGGRARCCDGAQRHALPLDRRRDAEHKTIGDHVRLRHARVRVPHGLCEATTGDEGWCEHAQAQGQGRWR
jgi:hypothetical protein